MSSIKETAGQFMDACDLGKGWEVCQQYCHPGATFSAQADALAEIDSLEAYTAWAKGLLTPIPNGTYDLRALAVDEERNSVSGFRDI